MTLREFMSLVDAYVALGVLRPKVGEIATGKLDEINDPDSVEEARAWLQRVGEELGDSDAELSEEIDDALEDFEDRKAELEDEEEAEANGEPNEDETEGIK